ncbi:hypothetical protein DOE63_01755 [Salmonella enterica subsp. diarizonae serovar 59:z10:-]|nr:hypothetical protein DOE63_01755 [Salmonella enterica subsp. diarizonae serovar 59:z10:-]
MVNCAGLRLPDQPTGQPFGCPTQPTIMRRCGCANDNKKHARGVSLSRLVFRGLNPGSRICGCVETIAPEIIKGQYLKTYFGRQPREQSVPCDHIWLFA